jgi:hypothetical protein
MFMEIKALWLQPILNVNKEGEALDLLASIEWMGESRFKKVNTNSKSVVDSFNLSLNDKSKGRIHFK